MERPETLDSRPLTEPHPTRLAQHHPQREQILAEHQAAMARGKPSYRDPATGYTVLTAAYLASRGRCCQTGCRHCPYVSDAAHVFLADDQARPGDSS